MVVRIVVRIGRVVVLIVPRIGTLLHQAFAQLFGRVSGMVVRIFRVVVRIVPRVGV